MPHHDTPTGPNPSGLCQCGCGEPAPIATQSDARRGNVKGMPVRYVLGHKGRLSPPEADTLRQLNPSGLCMCQCGEPAPLAMQSVYNRGYVRGQPMRFIAGHQCRLTSPEHVVEDRGYTTPCWVWQRTKADGYGRVHRHGKSMQAHRVYYERQHGQIPDRLDLDHLCRNRDCVNPDHLEPVTRRDNMLCGNHPSAIAFRSGTCTRGHVRTPENTHTGPDDKLTCRECARAIGRRRRERVRRHKSA